jgi:predicted metal-dependent hydrolase
MGRKGPKPPLAGRPVARDPQALATAVRQFNSWRFWDCHETLEELWQQEETALADLYQGLIKAAAGFHHLLRRNGRGARLLLSGALALLQPFPSPCLGLDLQGLRQGIQRCLQELEAQGPHRFDLSLLPTLHYRPEAGDGPP